MKIFSGADAALLRTIVAYGTNFTGGIRVAAGDTDDEGHVDVVTAPVGGTASLIRVFRGDTGVFERSFLAYGSRYTGGAFIAVAR